MTMQGKPQTTWTEATFDLPLGLNLWVGQQRLFNTGERDLTNCLIVEIRHTIRCTEVDVIYKKSPE